MIQAAKRTTTRAQSRRKDRSARARQIRKHIKPNLKSLEENIVKHHLEREAAEETGSNPRLSEPFKDFIEAAWNSLGDDLPDEPWDRTIRTALSRYAGQWDFYERLADS